MNRTLLALYLLVFPVVASAADKWTVVQSKNFLLAGNASENQIRDVAENLELFRTAFGKFFRLQEKAATVGTTVIVFKSDASFRPYKPLYQGKPANIAGYFQGGQDKNLIVLSADIETPRVIYHEYIHKLMSDNLASLPPWFQEGFAECFSNLEIEGRDKKLRLGRAIGEHVALLNERRFMPLEQLFAVTNESKEYNEQERQGLFYAESWALVHYMMLGPEDRRVRFFKFLDGLNQGTPAPVVFQRVFETDLATFQRTFEAYIQQRLAWPAMEMNPPRPLDRNKEMTSRPLSEAEAEFYLADMLLHDDRFAAAESHLRAALKLDPKLAEAQAAMGQLLLRRNQETDAIPYLERATQLDPRNHLAHYYFALALQGTNGPRTDEEWNLARSELQKAIELAPQFVAASELLGNLNLLRNADIPQTVEFLRRARTFAPGNDNLTVMLAFALSRTPEREQARPLAEAVLMKSSLNPTMRKNAEAVLTNLNQVAARSQRQSSSPPMPSAAVLQGAETMRGVLTAIECSNNGATLVLTADGKTMRFHSSSPNQIRFSAATASSLPGPLGCGPLPGGGAPAIIYYRAEGSSGNAGEPLAVEFAERN